MNGAIRDAVMEWRSARADFSAQPSMNRAIAIQRAARRHRELLRKNLNIFNGGVSK